MPITNAARCLSIRAALRVRLALLPLAVVALVDLHELTDLALQFLGTPLRLLDDVRRDARRALATALVPRCTVRVLVDGDREQGEDAVTPGIRVRDAAVLRADRAAPAAVRLALER